MLRAPTNIRTRKGERLLHVGSDVYNICERVKEIDTRLSIIVHEGREKPFVVIERCDDGVERMVARYAELDARILEDLRRMLAIPATERVEKLQRQIDRENAENDKMDPEKWERFTYEFQKALVDSNLSTPVWFKSYRPRPRG